MQHHQLKFPKTAHYYSLGNVSPSCKKVFFVLHGYGQLASKMIYKFDQLSSDYLFIAPEGFSRFYWNEKKGIVGASWMTKANRLNEIEDYSNFLQQLYDHFIAKLPQEVEINILGFSQGGATAVRWLENKRPLFHNLILWGAAFPEDLDYKSLKDYLTPKQLYVVHGRQDPYLSPEKIDKHQDFCLDQGLDYEAIWFDGKHEIDRNVLSKLVEQLDH